MQYRPKPDSRNCLGEGLQSGMISTDRRNTCLKRVCWYLVLQGLSRSLGSCLTPPL
ncbi:hypothetical protein GGR93_003346 [Sulfitobacter noctilucicola]|uniref:Uncharacterized protein n=1 Tax=Sulfitobacter noctilucicola TaxID=1342301 RepID=A0A7W6Q5A8_9RHOB|nr:hypothetical protein [Sulfitobacter noctilucicola]